MELFLSVALLSLSQTLWKHLTPFDEGAKSGIPWPHCCVPLCPSTIDAHHRWKGIAACHKKSLVLASLPTFPSSELGEGPDAVIHCFSGLKSCIFLCNEGVKPWPHVATWWRLGWNRYHHHQHWTKCSSSTDIHLGFTKSVVLQGANHAKEAALGRTFSLWAFMDEPSKSSIICWMLWYGHECPRKIVPLSEQA